MLIISVKLIATFKHLILAYKMLFFILISCFGPHRHIPQPITYNTEAGFSEKMDSWLGGDANDWVRKMGPPDKVFVMPNGNKLWTYNLNVAEYITQVTATSYYNEYYDTVETVYSGGDTITYYCKTEIEVNNAMQIVKWKSIGNNCKSRPTIEGKTCSGVISTDMIIDINNKDYGSVAKISLIFGGDVFVDVNAATNMNDWIYKRIGVCSKSPFGSYIAVRSAGTTQFMVILFHSMGLRTLDEYYWKVDFHKTYNGYMEK